MALLISWGFIGEKEFKDKDRWVLYLHQLVVKSIATRALEFMILMITNIIDYFFISPNVSPLLDKCDRPMMVEDQGVLKVVRELDEACRVAGFFYVKGHGIPDSLVKEVKEVTRKFFDLPYEEKVKIKMSPKTGYRGYQRLGENITLGKPDMHEAIDCYRPMESGEYGSFGKNMEGKNLWPENPANFKSLMEQYISLQKELARKIMQGIALALGGPPETFEGERAGNSFWVMRIIGYPGLAGEMQYNDVGW
ncbi:hypothetical protein IEQ34_010247 [Dendrobium chrysotoxum]|uniref:Non-haem dioxygenase N-terminal domain-containing protein n=1 Tax=Dendrobium chrysotoxum TaxID=161865 RepID=A0AAV7H1C8_DENCH|nr:hypothetical protein IEQ34_010247 [Dendrobium chrysotoxum]